MNKLEKNQRDVRRDQLDAFTYKGFVFLRYEGPLSQDEYRSKQHYYAFWGDRHYTQRVIMFMVDTALQQGQLPKAA